MRLLYRIGVISLLLLIGIPIVLLMNQDAFQETDAVFYETFDAASKAGAFERGSLPTFLPLSATSIYEKQNIDYNTGIIAFSIRPEDWKSLSRICKKVPDDSLKEIRPDWVYWQEKWFPESIVRGKTVDLRSKGFDLYEVDYTTKFRKHWYLAYNKQTGQGYVWN